MNLTIGTKTIEITSCTRKRDTQKGFFLEMVIPKENIGMDELYALLDDNTEVTIWGNSANRTVNEALAVVGKHGYVTGQFTGDGEMTYRLTLGFQPKFCAVIRDESLGERPLFVLAGTVSGPADSGLADSMKVLYTINSTGITFTKHSSSSTGVFSSGKTYSYIAFR